MRNGSKREADPGAYVCVYGFAVRASTFVRRGSEVNLMGIFSNRSWCCGCEREREREKESLTLQLLRSITLNMMWV